MKTIDEAVADDVAAQLHDHAIIADASTNVLAEWNMNGVFPAVGLNDLSGGDDLYVATTTVADRASLVQDARLTNEIAKPWRESNGIALWRGFSGDNSKTKAISSDTRVYALGDEGSYAYWTSPLPSAPISSAGWKCDGESLLVGTPAAQSNEFVRLLGFTTETNQIKFITNKPFPSGIQSLAVYSPESSTVKSFGVTVTGEFTVVSQATAWSNSKVYRGSAKGTSTLFFGSYNSVSGQSAIAVGQRIKSATIGGTSPAGAWASWSAVVTGVSELRAPNGSYWTQVSVSKPLPTNVNPGQIFSTESNVVTVTSSGVTQLSDSGYIPGTFAYFSFKRIQALSGVLGVMQHTSAATTSAGVNTAINNLSRLGGGALKFTGNITLTEPVIIPSNARVKFDGTITCQAGFSSAYDYAVYLTNASPFVTVQSAVAGNTYLDIAASTSADSKSRIVPNATLLIKVPTITSVTSNGRTITTSSEKLYSYKVLSFSGNRVNIDGQILADITSAPMFVNSPVDVSNVIGNSYIDGGTWNLDGGTAKRAGFVRVANANGIRVSRATINNASNVPTVSVAGCNNVLIKTLTIQNTLHAAGTTPAIELSSHTSRDAVDACFNIVIEQCSIAGRVGVASVIPSNSETSRHQTVRISDNTIAAETGLDLSDIAHCAVLRNTITASGSTGVGIASVRSACTNNLIANNTITLASSAGNRSVVLASTGSTRPVIYSRIINNTLSGAETSKRIQLLRTCFTQIYGNTDVTNSTTVVREADAETYYSSATVYGVRHSAPTVQYVTDRSEVVAFRQWGEKITVMLAKAMPDVRVGNYILITDVHEAINGTRKIVAISQDRMALTLKSQISAITPSENPSGLNYVKQGDKVGMAYVARPVPVNKIVVKFETTYGTPNTCFVQTKSNSSWETIYSMTSSSELSSESELDLVSDDNIKTLTIYRNDAGAWGLTQQDFDIELNQNIDSIDAIRVVIGSTTANNANPSVVEISGRLQADISKYVMSWSADCELDSGDRFAPVGNAVTGGGTVEIDNSTQIFNKYNKSSPFYGLFTEKAFVHIYTTMAGRKIKVATMLSDSWSEDSVSLIDKSYILQSQKARDMFVYGGWDRPGISVQDAFSGILDSIGFGNYRFCGSDGFGQMKYVFTKEEDSPWDVLREIAQVHQCALVFDRLGQLQIMSRKYVYGQSLPDYTIVGDNLRSKAVGRTDFSGYGGAFQHHNFSVVTNQQLPHDAPAMDTDSLAVEIRKEPEFYVNRCSKSGTTVSMTLTKTNPDLAIHTGNNKFYVAEMGSPFDGFHTLTSGPTLSGSDYNITYTVAGAGTIPINNDYPGEVGYADNAQVAFLASGLTTGKLYRYRGYVFIPSSNSAGYSVKPNAYGVTVQYDQFTYTNKNESVPFDLKFVATGESQYVGFVISGANSSDSVFVYDDEILFDDTGLEDGYDSVIEGATETLIPASKVIVSYTSANQYKESTTQLGGMLELGKNATLWEMPDLIIPSLSVDILNWTTFRFSVEAGGYDSSSVSIGDSINMSGNPKDQDYLGIPFTGKFFLKGKFMEYFGVEASAPHATPPQTRVITSLDDLLSIRETNQGIAPKWTGRGFFSWSYPPPLIHYPGATIRVKQASAPSVAQVPSLYLDPATNLNGAIIRPGRDAVSIVWEPRVASVKTIGASVGADTRNVVAGSVSLFIMGSRYKHTIGVSWPQSGLLAPYGASVPVNGGQATQLAMELVASPVGTLQVSQLQKANLEVRVTSTKINTTFDLYLNQYFVGSLRTNLILDDVGAGTKVGVTLSPGMPGAVKRLYAAEAQPKIPPSGGSQEVYLFGVESEGYVVDRVEF